MPEIPFALYFICLILFTLIDKGLTVASLHQINKNFPEADTLKAEKNPLARFFFDKLGLAWGTVAMTIFSIAWMSAFWFLGSWIFGSDKQSVYLYILFLLYGFVIFNNIYFLLKYSRIIA